MLCLTIYREAGSFCYRALGWGPSVRCQSGSILQVQPTYQKLINSYTQVSARCCEWKSQLLELPVTVLFRCQFSEMSRRLSETPHSATAASQRLRDATLAHTGTLLPTLWLTGRACSAPGDPVTLGLTGMLLPTLGLTGAARSGRPRPHTRAHGRAAQRPRRPHSGLRARCSHTDSRRAAAQIPPTPHWLTGAAAASDSPPHTRAHGRAASDSTTPHSGSRGAPLSDSTTPHTRAHGALLRSETQLTGKARGSRSRRYLLPVICMYRIT